MELYKGHMHMCLFICQYFEFRSLKLENARINYLHESTRKHYIHEIDLYPNKQAWNYTPERFRAGKVTILISNRILRIVINTVKRRRNNYLYKQFELWQENSWPKRFRLHARQKMPLTYPTMKKPWCPWSKAAMQNCHA